MISESVQFRQVIQKFDAVHRQDPRKVTVNGKQITWSLLYHRRLTYWIRRLEPNASKALLIAARCQHLSRWNLPRDDYPKGRSGYKNWRKNAAKVHAQEAAKILREVGYKETIIGRLQELLQKVHLKLDPEVQLFEDAICLVFLENELLGFSNKYDGQKLVLILQKTWRKMSPTGHRTALEIVTKLPKEIRVLVKKATEN